MSGEFEQLLTQLSRDNTLYESREEVIRQGVINAILYKIGWDTFNYHEVVPEYRVENGRVDYCLKIREKKCVFIEVKRLSEDLEPHEKQLLEYSFAEGIEIAVLTNGLLWWLYLPLAGGTWQQRKFFTIDIRQQDSEVAAKHFFDFLSRGAISDGSGLRSAKEVHASREKENRIKQTLPQAWEQLLIEPEMRLIDLLAEKVESMCGYQPEPLIVKRFILDIAKYQEPALSSISPRSVVNRPTKERKPVEVKDQTPTSRSQKQQSVIVKIDGKIMEANSVSKLYKQVLIYLVDSNIINKVTDKLPFGISSQRYLLAKSPYHPGGNEFVRPVEYKGYYIESHKSYENAIVSLKSLFKLCGVQMEVLNSL